MSLPQDPLSQLLIRHEGVRYSPYTDTTGHLTVGVGHNLDAHPIVPPPTYPLDDEQVSTLLAQDIADAEDQLSLNVDFFPTLDTVRQAAMTDLCFNIGINSLLSFHMFLHFMGTQQWNAAAGDLLATLYAREVGRRAADLAAMINTGVWLEISP